MLITRFSLVISDRMDYVGKKKIIKIIFDCYRLSDGYVHRETVNIHGKDFSPSLEYLQHLIERELNIPRGCAIDISTDDIKLNCSLTDSLIGSLPRGLFTRTTPLLISIRYYTSCTSFSFLVHLLERFDKSLQDYNYVELGRVLSRFEDQILNTTGWGSPESTGVCLFLAKVGFIEKVFQCMQLIHTLLSMVLLRSDFVFTDPPYINQFQTRILCQCLCSCQSFLWNFGANVEDRLYLYKKGFLPLSLVSLEISEKLKKCSDKFSVDLGTTLSSVTFGMFGGVSEIWPIAEDFGGKYSFFFNVLEHTVLTNPNNPNTTDIFDVANASGMFMIFSSHCEISKQFISGGLYEKVIKFYLNEKYHEDFGDKIYCVCLSLINMLSTPGTWCMNSLTPDLILQMWTHFLNEVSPEDVSQYEKDHSYIWGSLEPFTILYFPPKTSYLGFQQGLTNSVNRNRIIEVYTQLALFSLEVVLMLEGNLELLIKQNLFTHLIIADWNFGSIAQKLRHYYPHLTHFPVPSLYDISATTAIREGLGDFSRFYH